ncbi:MAG: RepB family DNA primase [Bryobacteraceae bacterium]
MQSHIRTKNRISSTSDRTIEAVRRQATAMASDVFEIGLFKPDVVGDEAVMLPRVWDTDTLLRSVPWLRHQNRDGRNIYIRPRGEHNLSLVDDLTRDAVLAMKQAGFTPATIIETSPGNFQAWVKHPEQLTKELGTAAARKLAERFGGDPAAADWRHFGRLGGFTNRKRKYCDPETGLHPFVKLIEAGGAVYRQAERFLAEVRSALEREQHEREQLRRILQPSQTTRSTELKSIDSFRGAPKYGGDGTRIDLAYAIYAASHGATEAEIGAAIRSRDLSHKGGEARQADYVERTIKKAFERGRGR